MNIYVGNLPYSVRDQELRETFEAYGAVTVAEVIFDKRTRRSRGYGFVEMASEVDAQSAIAALNGKELQGRELRVDASQPKTDKPPRADGDVRERAPRRPSPQQATGREAAAPPSPAHAPAGIKGFFKRLFG